MGNDLALVSAHNHYPTKDPFLLTLVNIDQSGEREKMTLTFTSLTFLFFWSLLLNYLFLLVYLLWN